MFKQNLYFNHNEKIDRYIPRVIFMDYDKTSIDSLRSSYLGSYMLEEQFFSRNFAEPMLIWPKAYYADGAEIIFDAMDIVRREIERQDCPQGFQLFNNLSGGFGSGFSNLVLGKLQKLSASSESMQAQALININVNYYYFHFSIFNGMSKTSILSFW